MNSVVELRRAGNKVRVIHRRWTLTPDGDALLSKFEAEQLGLEWLPYSNGGITTIEVTSKDGVTTSGQALCSDNDSFCRKFGVQKALERALGHSPQLVVHGESKKIVEMDATSIDSVLETEAMIAQFEREFPQQDI